MPSTPRRVLSYSVCLALVLLLWPVVAKAHVPGRMTGGGTICDTDVHFGLELHCAFPENTPPPTPNNLEINFKDPDTGEEHNFHLTDLETAVCLPESHPSGGNPNAAFDTLTGSGTGTLDGVAGYTVQFVFTDNGEPGTNDIADIQILDADGNIVLDVSDNLCFGDLQAHSDNDND
jgi:hypothetical protein